MLTFYLHRIKLINLWNVSLRQQSTSTIGFIGLGNMGSRMARNLQKTHQLHIYDINTPSPNLIPGAKIFNTPEDTCKNCSIIITMLPNGLIVKNIIIKLIKAMEKNSILIDCSTIEPQTAQELSKIVSDHGGRFIDAPVSGGMTGADSATLTFMVGGDVNVADEIKPILMAMGKKVFHCGNVGSGQIAKLCNNLILGITMIATAEGMNLGAKLGLNLKTLADIISVSSGRSWTSEIYNPVPGIIDGVPASNNYEGGFSCNLMAKDLNLAENAALTCGAPVIFTATAHQLYRLLITHGHGNRDLGVIYQFLKDIKD